jgi:hypothetical protein
MRLIVESPHGMAPTVALINGHPADLRVVSADPADADLPAITTAAYPATVLGSEPLSLFVAIRTPKPGTNAELWVLPEDAASAAGWAEATAAVTPFLKGWLGPAPRAPLTILDLPDAKDSPFETGALLATPVRQANPEMLDGILAHALTHAWVQSPKAWISEGAAYFMGTLWIEKQQGRARALEALESGHAALAMIEPQSPGEAAGQPLALAFSPIYYRAKAGYIFWMLRDLAGDPAIAAALRAYDPTTDISLGYGRDPQPGPGNPGIFEAVLEKTAEHSELKWFFADWVDADKGLPDLSIESVFPTQQAGGSWLVAVNVNNDGYAAAEVPVTVRSQSTTVTKRLMVTARGKATQRVLIQEKPVEVQVNDGTVPETQASVHVRRLGGDSSSSSMPDAPLEPAK